MKPNPRRMQFIALLSLALLLALSDAKSTPEQQPKQRKAQHAQQLKEWKESRVFEGKSQYSGPSCSDPNVQSTLPFCLPANYEKHVRPPGRGPVLVNVNLRVDDIEDVSDVNLTMTVQARVNVSWTDGRLLFTTNKTVWDRDDPKQALKTMDPLLAEKYLWMPDLAVYNQKEFGVSHVLRRLSGLKLHARTGALSYSADVRVVLACYFHFEKYPLDEQQCDFVVGSYGHTADEMRFKGDFRHNWMRQRPLPYKVRVVPLSKDKLTYTSDDDQETYSVMGFSVNMVRSHKGYVVRTYFPAALVVAVSWVSFLITQKEVSGRLALLVTLMLVEINILNAIMAKAIPSSTITAIKIYVLACFAFVLLSLLEFSIIMCQISHVARAKERAVGKLGNDLKGKKGGQNGVEEGKEEEEKAKSETNKEGYTENKKIFNIDTKDIDIASCIFFPLAFIVFNVIYWVYFLVF